MERTESLILRGLMYNDKYARRVLPYISPEYFHDQTEKLLFNKIKEHIDKYNVLPTKETLIIDINETDGVIQEQRDECSEYLSSLEQEKDNEPDHTWLVDLTERFCQELAISNAVVEAITILEDNKDPKKREKRPKTAIPKLLQDALGVSFDPYVGHDYFNDAELRYESYHKVDTKLPFHLKYLNLLTKNGVPKRTLNICLAGTNVGKSMFMCDLACHYIRSGKKVLYISMEMDEDRVAERIDANLMDRPTDDLPLLSKASYLRLIEKLYKTTKGNLIIKQFPTSQAHVHHFRHLLNELQLKKNFKPDVIFIDYLNICASSRVKATSGMYEMVKCIAEEIRGLAVEFDVPIWSATQTNREGFSSSDPDLTHTSESFGLPATADLMIALLQPDEMKPMNQMIIKPLKNRYGDIFIRDKETGKVIGKFVIGCDKSRQKMFDVDEVAQKNITQDVGIQAPFDDDTTPPETADPVTFDIDDLLKAPEQVTTIVKRQQSAFETAKQRQRIRVNG